MRRSWQYHKRFARQHGNKSGSCCHYHMRICTASSLSPDPIVTVAAVMSRTVDYTPPGVAQQLP